MSFTKQELTNCLAAYGLHRSNRLYEQLTQPIAGADNMTDRDKEVAELSPATAAKYDKVNIHRGVIGRFPMAIREIAKVSAFGCVKHGQIMGSMSYLEVPDAEFVYLEAEQRHAVAETIEGPVNYDDGNLLHKAQKAWSALADLEVYLRQGPNYNEQPK